MMESDASAEAEVRLMFPAPPRPLEVCDERRQRVFES